jgi:hypothetical protein
MTMAITDAMITHIAKTIIGESVTTFAEANAHIGVGSSTTAFAASQTDLQAASDKVRKAMYSGYPQRSTNALKFKSTFGESDGNFAWQEWAVFNASSGGTMANRKVESKGTKSGGSWVFEVTLTPTIGS